MCCRVHIEKQSRRKCLRTSELRGIEDASVSAVSTAGPLQMPSLPSHPFLQPFVRARVIPQTLTENFPDNITGCECDEQGSGPHGTCIQINLDLSEGEPIMIENSRTVLCLTEATRPHMGI